MGIELELIVLMVFQALGSSYFSQFEGGQPGTRKFLKWVVFDGATIGLYYLAGHYALLFPAFILVVGTFFHIRWCKKNGIDPVKATPRKKYYALRGWKWEE